jgi:hypothetical protein
MGSSGGSSSPPNYPQPPAQNVVPYGQSSQAPQNAYVNFLTPNQVSTGISPGAIQQMDALNKPEPSSPAQLAQSPSPTPLTRNSLSTLMAGR